MYNFNTYYLIKNLLYQKKKNLYPINCYSENIQNNKFVKMLFLKFHYHRSEMYHCVQGEEGTRKNGTRSGLADTNVESWCWERGQGRGWMEWQSIGFSTCSQRQPSQQSQVLEGQRRQRFQRARYSFGVAFSKLTSAVALRRHRYSRGPASSRSDRIPSLADCGTAIVYRFLCCFCHFL